MKRGAYLTTMTMSEYLERLCRSAAELRHHIRLWWCGFGERRQYRSYLREQLRRTLLKRITTPQLRTKLLVEKLLEVGHPSQKARVLCMGSRNRFELAHFLDRGFASVVGIDLYSEEADILVMDMHRMTFPDDHFAVVYSCHSLEHAYDMKRVVKEIVRVAQEGALVAIEVPVRYQTTGADLIDFGNLDNLLAAFHPHVMDVFWSEEQEPRTIRNDCGTPVLRTVFSLAKSRRSVHSKHESDVEDQARCSVLG